MKRQYPLFIIDKAVTEGFPYHHIAVMGEEPFFVRVRLLKNLNDYTPTGAFLLHPLHKGAVLFEVVSTNYDSPKIQSLLKKAAKKYMLGYKTNNYKNKELSLDNQIYQQQLTIEHQKRNFAHLVARAGGDENLAKYNIALAQATLESLQQLKELKNGK